MSFTQEIDQLYLNVSSMYTRQINMYNFIKKETKDLSIKQIWLGKKGQWMAFPKVSEGHGIVWLHT